MTSTPHARSSRAGATGFVVLLLFVGSGGAALIYEVAWFQLLQFSIGSSSMSLGILLGTFMGGLCLGSVLAPHAIAPHRHALRVYGCLALTVGALGLLLLGIVQPVGRVCVGWAGAGAGELLLRTAAAAVCLLPPTAIMGATLPVIARWVRATPRGASWIGLCYAGNLAGAVLGSLLAGLMLLRLYDVVVATYAAAGINAVAGVTALVLAGRAADLGPWLPDAAVNRDRNLRLQYLAGLGLNVRQRGRIYSAIQSYRRVPDDLFVGSEELLGRLASAIGQGPE